MQRYSKAYYARDFRRFEGWTEKVFDKPFEDDHILYLHDNYVVTDDGICSDQRVVFDDVTEEWKTFCTETLGFDIPDNIQSSR